MKTQFIVLALTITFSGLAQTGFELTAVNDFTPDVKNIEKVDIDGDGLLDILVVGFDEINWHKNDGSSNNFSTKRAISSVKEFVRAVTPLDVDMDGDLDFVMTTLTSGLIYYQNLGAGVFAPKVTLPGTINYLSLKSRDMDMDGDLDLVYVTTVGVNGFNHDLGYLVNNGGSSNFTVSHTIYSFNNVPVDYEITDLNGDTLPDLMISLQFGNLIGVLNNGGGNFATPVNLNAPNRVRQIVLIDMDADGDKDLVYHDTDPSSESKVRMRRNNGNGTFASPNTLASLSSSPLYIEVNDFNGDGMPDFLASQVVPLTNNTELDLQLFQANSATSFTRQPNILTAYTSLAKFISHDFTGDNLLDVVYANNSNELSFLKKSSATAFHNPLIIASGSQYDTFVDTGDVNNDGIIDVVSISLTDGKLSILNGVPGNSEYNTQRVISRLDYNAKIIRLKDLDGDSDLDILIMGGDYIAVYMNLDALGNYGPRNLIYNVNNAGIDGLLILDVDGDGDLDIVSAIELRLSNPVVDNIIWFENTNGLASYAPAQTLIANVDSVYNLQSADLNGDGLPDLIYSSLRGNRINYYRRLGTTGGYAPVQYFANNRQALVFTVGDINNDGYQDIIYGLTVINSSSLFVIENRNNSGTFSAPTAISTINGRTDTAVSLKITDINSDGYNDIYAVYNNNSTLDFVAWFENLDGNLAMSNARTIPITNGIVLNNVAYSDFNDNGLLDVFVSGIPGFISRIENLGERFNRIEGVVRLDDNANGCDTQDRKLPLIKVSTTDGTNHFSTFTYNIQNLGTYELFVGQGTFTTSLSSTIPTFFQSIPVQAVSNLTTTGMVDVKDFCLEPVNPFDDISVLIVPDRGETRPGFNKTFTIYFKNEGSTILNGNITFQFDNSQMNYLSSNGSVTSQTANSISFNFANLSRFETRDIAVNFYINPPPIVNSNDYIGVNVNATITGNDIHPNDNTFNLNLLVINSYDPNDITVLEGSEILLPQADGYLHYLIRFQNTGTASAVNVRIANIIDNLLDTDTFELEELSHSGRVEIKNNRFVNFIFDHIYLADSTSNEPASHGFVRYRIKPKQNAIVGNVYSSKASIFFDFNEPIITNTVTTTIVTTLSMQQSMAANVVVYPNPTRGMIMASSPSGIMEYKIYDLSGRLLSSHKFIQPQHEIKIDMTSYTNGLLLLELIVEDNVIISKIIKEE
ncbi:MAG: T9SS type A sorting domain-containing protein [Nonlabens sp.]|nr:T9SS type A sorting domain-containing protein [Nonlabens sp.]